MRRRSVLIAAAIGLVVAGVLPAPAARAATTVKIKGGGWGHGIGMSQYGAYGRALNGRSEVEILEHYYSGAKVSSTNMPGKIRVGLLQGRRSVSFGSQALGDGSGKVVVKVAGTKGALAEGGPGTAWRIESSSTGGLRLYKNGSTVKRDGRRVFGGPAHPLVLVFERYGTLLRVNEKSNNYAYGRMQVGSYDAGGCDVGYCTRVVLTTTMQKYLYGLGEVPASWPAAALRTQAIAGRTYALEKVRRLGQHRHPCDCAVYDSTIDQAYIGDAKRTGSGRYWDDWKAAVDATKGRVVLYGGAPVQALYSSSSGGHTENNENVWGGTPLPYLRGVPDAPDAVDANPNHTWQVQMSFSDFEGKLQAAYGMGSLRDFALVEPFGVSGRVTVVKSDSAGGARIKGSKKTVRTSGWSLRSALNLKDTLFRVRIDYDVGSRYADKYGALDRAPGAPESASYPVPVGWKEPLGSAQDFERGRMTWRAKTEKTVWQHGPVLKRYDAMAREKGPLGMPTSDVWGPGRFLGANYVRGSIYWSNDTGAHAVRGALVKPYRRNEGPRGPLGLPKGDRESADTLPGKGLRQRFEGGRLYLNPKLDKAFALWGPVGARYRKMGEASSKCGYPASDLVKDRFGQRARFEDGIISWTDHGGIVVECL